MNPLALQYTTLLHLANDIEIARRMKWEDCIEYLRNIRSKIVEDNPSSPDSDGSSLIPVAEGQAFMNMAHKMEMMARSAQLEIGDLVFKLKCLISTFMNQLYEVKKASVEGRTLEIESQGILFNPLIEYMDQEAVDLGARITEWEETIGKWNCRAKMCLDFRTRVENNVKNKRNE